MTYWFVKSQTNLCWLNPSFTQTDFRFYELMQKREIFNKIQMLHFKSYAKFLINSFSGHVKNVCQDGQTSSAPCRWAEALKLFERYDLVKSMQYVQHTSSHMNTNTNTHLNKHTDAPASPYTIAHVHTTFYAPRDSSSLPHPHIIVAHTRSLSLHFIKQLLNIYK